MILVLIALLCCAIFDSAAVTGERTESVPLYSEVRSSLR